MDSHISYNDHEHIESQLSKTQHLERAYEETVRKAELIFKDEAARRLKVRIMALEHDNNDLHEQLVQQEDRIDELEQGGDELRTQLEEAQESASSFEAELRSQIREINSLKVELNAMNGVTTDSTKLLTEKLSLARELATLKPELEHLRSQSTYQQTVLSEKLALQRQVNTLEVELETEKRASKRAAQKNNNQEKEIELQALVEDLQKDLAREQRETEVARKQVSALEAEVESEKRALKRANSKAKNNERELEFQHQVDALEKEVAREKRDTEKARKQVDDLESQMEEMEKRISKLTAQKTSNGEKELAFQHELEDAQKTIATERREKEKLRKDTKKELEISEAQKSALESKLDQMRTKLRSTKEQLKECQVELAQARATAGKAAMTSKAPDVPAKNPRKRSAVDMSTDDAIGTPDGVAIRGKRLIAKRGRLDHTMVGEKSMFSITPYLNRTVNMAPDTPNQEERDSPVDEDVEKESETETKGSEAATDRPSEALVDDKVSTPSAPPKTKPKAKGKPVKKKVPTEKNVLGEARSGTSNKKTASRKPHPISTLEKVAEEEIDENEPAMTATTTDKAPVKKSDIAKTKEAPKVVEELEPKKKKRKLLGGGKTLFDEDDPEVAKRPSKVTLGAPKLLGRGGLAGPKGNLRGGLATAGSFGAFSPLKKDRRGIGASFLA